MIPAFKQRSVPEFAIDLGSSRTRVYKRGQGIVASQASAVALKGSKEGAQVVAVGDRAREMSGKTSAQIRNTKPLSRGKVESVAGTEILVRELLLPLAGKARLLGPRVLTGVPCDITAIERNALHEAFSRAGVSEMFTVPEVLAAAIGAGLPVGDSCGFMVIDLGGEQSTVAVVSLDGVVKSASTKTAGDQLDFLLVDYLRRERGISIGIHSAEKLKRQIGAALPHDNGREAAVYGQNARTGLPMSLTVCEAEALKAFGNAFDDTVALVHELLDVIPPEIASDLLDTGAILVGGGALLPEFDLLLSERTGIPMTLTEDPTSAVVSGCGVILDQWSRYKHLIVQ